jgi:hypothetical protein
MKNQLTSSIIVFLQLAFSVSAQSQTKITGIWQNSTLGYQMVLILNENKTGEFDGESINYTVTANKPRLCNRSSNIS